MRTHLINRSAPVSRAKPLGLFAAAAVAALMVFAAPTPAMAQEPSGEDLRALVYYLDHDDQRSVQAELRRLRAQFPQWTPPGDLSQLRAATQTAQATVDERPIWALIERQDFEGARTLIAQGRARVPTYSPNPDLIRILDTNESQSTFEQAYTRRDLTAAVSAVRRTPSLMRCDRINNAWRLAELYAQAEQNSNAVGTYRGVLQSCQRISDVVPTLEKADEVASWEEMTALFDVARAQSPASTDTLNALQERLRAGRGAPRVATAVARAPAPAAPAAPAPAVTTARAASTTVAPRAPEPVAAAQPAVSAGAIPYAQLPTRGDSRVAQVRQLKEQGNWAGCVAASANPRSLEVLYERSWCAYNLDRSGEALAGFTATAARATALGGDVPRDARFGMILSYLDMNMTEEGARLAAATPLTQTQRVEVEGTILDQRAVRAFHGRDYAQSIAYLTALEQLRGTLPRDLAMLRGYSYLNNGQREQAQAEFMRLHQELATDETRAALSSIQGAATR